MLQSWDEEITCTNCGYEMIASTPLLSNPSTWAKKQHIDQSFATDAVLWDGVIEEMGVAE